METLIVHPENKEQLAAIKAFMKALKINFEKRSDESKYNPDFVKMIKKAERNPSYKTVDSKKSLAEQFAGSLHLSEDDYNKFQKHLIDVRNEWDRNI